jgi:CO/xanthine dehydrogenase Mo-binding subunit
VGAGAAAVLSAIMDALGGEYLGRSPITPDRVLTYLEGRAQPHGPFATHV